MWIINRNSCPVPKFDAHALLNCIATLNRSRHKWFYSDQKSFVHVFTYLVFFIPSLLSLRLGTKSKKQKGTKLTIITLKNNSSLAIKLNSKGRVKNGKEEGNLGKQKKVATVALVDQAITVKIFART